MELMTAATAAHATCTVDAVLVAFAAAGLLSSTASAGSTGAGAGAGALVPMASMVVSMMLPSPAAHKVEDPMQAAPPFAAAVVRVYSS